MCSIAANNALYVVTVLDLLLIVLVIPVVTHFLSMDSCAHSSSVSMEGVMFVTQAVQLIRTTKRSFCVHLTYMVGGKIVFRRLGRGVQMFALSDKLPRSKKNTMFMTGAREIFCLSGKCFSPKK